MKGGIIRDIKLAESGHRKIEWVKGHRPICMGWYKQDHQPYSCRLGCGCNRLWLVW